MNIEFKLYGQFKMLADGMDITPVGKECEFLAFLIVLAGEEANAKNYWENVLKPKHLKYNASYFSLVRKNLVRYMNGYGVRDVLVINNTPVRACRIDRDKVCCDYYQMLDGKKPFQDTASFLPEYPWANVLICNLS